MPTLLTNLLSSSSFSLHHILQLFYCLAGYAPPLIRFVSENRICHDFVCDSRSFGHSLFQEPFFDNDSSLFVLTEVSIPRGEKTAPFLNHHELHYTKLVSWILDQSVVMIRFFADRYDGRAACRDCRVRRRHQRNPFKSNHESLRCCPYSFEMTIDAHRRTDDLISSAQSRLNIWILWIVIFCFVGLENGAIKKAVFVTAF